LEFVGAYQRGHGLPMAGDHDGIAALGCTDILAELGFDLSNGSYARHGVLRR
jgi:hypothetical protein